MLSRKTLICPLMFASAVSPKPISAPLPVPFPTRGCGCAWRKIEVKSADTGAVFQGGASATGNYVIPVPVGNYSLTVTVTGFKKYIRQNLIVTVATATRQDVKLEVGAVTETVTTATEAPLLKTESGELSHSVTSEDANNLPVLTLSGGSKRFFQRLRQHS